MGPCQRSNLDGSCWIDLHRGWVHNHETVFASLVDQTPWAQESITLFGRQVPQPRLTAWFGLGMDIRTRYRTTAPAEPWPPSIEALRRELQGHTGVAFNSALANLYRDGGDAVAWHADDEPALGPAPVIASVSFGAPRRFRLRRRDGSLTSEVTLGHGDLLIMGGETQRSWLHCVPRTKAIVGPRINLTFRAYTPPA